MFEFLRDGLMTGFGAAVVSLERVENRVYRLVEEGKITMEEAKGLLTELRETGRSEWSSIQEKLKDGFSTGLKDLNVATGEELQSLEKRIDQIEKHLSLLRDDIQSLKSTSASSSSTEK